jgi:hypothetical protein
MPWHALLDQAFRKSRTIAVLIGKDGVGPWEKEEIAAAIYFAVEEQRPVIPIVLPGAPVAPQLPIFLKNRTWVDCRGDQPDRDRALELVVWGITGKKPVPL